MPRVKPDHIPKYRRHKATGRGVVTLNGRDRYFPGKYESKESKTAYDTLIAEWLAAGRILPSKEDKGKEDGDTINDLILAFWRFAEQHYRRPDGSPTSELADYRRTLKPLREMYGNLPVKEFGPLKLKAVRQRMMDADLCRRVITQRIGRIVRMFKWGVSEEKVPEGVYRALPTMLGLQRGRTDVRESEPVKPVPDVFVEATLDHVSPTIAAMIRLQRLTGMRSGELTAMRACDLDTSGPVWIYRPQTHKNAHRGKARLIAIGARGQEIIRPFFTLDLQAYLFSPKNAIAALNVAKRQSRKTKVQPSQVNRKKRKPRRKAGDRYTTISYGRAVTRGHRKADAAARAKAIKEGMPQAEADAREFVPAWHPHQLRHNLGTAVRREFGLEGAQIALGHSQANVTEIYAERDEALAVRIASQIG